MLGMDYLQLWRCTYIILCFDGNQLYVKKFAPVCLPGLTGSIDRIFDLINLIWFMFSFSKIVFQVVSFSINSTILDK